MIRRHRSRTDGNGQALTEFALIAPILFALLFGVIQIGMIMAAQNGLVNGVRDATRRAATYRINEASIDDNATFAGICDAIETQLTAKLQVEIPWFNTTLLDRTVAYEWQQNPTSGQYFLVAHIDASFYNPLYIPLISGFFDGRDGVTDGNLRLDASEQMRVENPTLTQPGTYASGRTCGA